MRILPGPRLNMLSGERYLPPSSGRCCTSSLLTGKFVVTYDKKYDSTSGSLSTVMCSDGLNGLMTKYGWKTYSQIPNFPYIGGSSVVTAWNSTGVRNFHFRGLCTSTYFLTARGNVPSRCIS